MKKILLLTLSLSLFIMSCSSDDDTIDLEKNSIENIESLNFNRNGTHQLVGDPDGGGGGGGGSSSSSGNSITGNCNYGSFEGNVDEPSIIRVSGDYYTENSQKKIMNLEIEKFPENVIINDLNASIVDRSISITSSGYNYIESSDSLEVYLTYNIYITYTTSAHATATELFGTYYKTFKVFPCAQVIN